MKIVIAGPMSLSILRQHAPVDDELGDGYAFPFVSQLMLRLLRSGHQITGVTTSSAATQVRRFTSDTGLSVYVCPSRPRPRRQVLDLFSVERRAMRDCIIEAGPDVVHAMWTYEFALAGIATGKPTLVTAHDWPPTVVRLSPTPYRAFRLVQGMYTIRRATHLTAPSPELASAVQRWRRRPVAVVPNGIDHQHARGRARPPAIGLSIGAVNQGWDRRKNVGTLLEAFAQVRRDAPGASLTLVGRDYEPDGPAHAWALSKGLEKGVRFVGPRDIATVRELMSEFDVFVHPSLNETFGMVLIEAMEAGAVVVAGERSGAVPWVLGGGECGVLVDVGSPAAIAQAVTSLATDTNRRARIAAAGRTRVLDHFTLDAVADQYMHQYRQVLGAETGYLPA